MKKIRMGTFETNSSSVHSLILCLAEEYEAFKRGETYLTKWGEQFVRKDMIDTTDSQYAYWSYDNFGGDMEIFKDMYITPSGEKVVAFGYFGRDG